MIIFIYIIYIPFLSFFLFCFKFYLHTLVTFYKEQIFLKKFDLQRNNSKRYMYIWKSYETYDIVFLYIWYIILFYIIYTIIYLFIIPIIYNMIILFIYHFLYIIYVHYNILYTLWSMLCFIYVYVMNIYILYKVHKKDLKINCQRKSMSFLYFICDTGQK